MKKILIHVASLMVLLVFAPSCEDERDHPEVQQSELPENAIGFSGAKWNDEPASRSFGELTSANITQMWVYAHATATDDFEVVAEQSTPDVMDKQFVSRNSEGEPWTYQPVQYWPPAGQKISFFAITHDHITLEEEDKGDSWIVIQRKDGPYEGYPYFKIKQDKDPSKQMDIGVASALNRTREGGTVQLTFNHIMHKVNFSARYVPEENFFTPALYVDGVSGFGDGGFIKVEQITLDDAPGMGDLNFDATGFCWENPTIIDSYILKAENNDLVADNLLPNGLPGADHTISTPTGTLLLVPAKGDVGVEGSVGVRPRVSLSATFCDGCSDAGEKTYTYSDVELPGSDWEAGESTTYNFTIRIPESDLRCWGFKYTGQARTFVAPVDGDYKLEAWGASGSRILEGYPGGNGGYAAGTIYLKQGQVLYIYVGEGRPKTTVDDVDIAAFNGGGRANVWSTYATGGVSGGATDFRLVNGAWNNDASLNSRILVAGGGSGGTCDDDKDEGIEGAAAGGLTGYKGNEYDNGVAGYPGEQTNGGQSVTGSGSTSHTSSPGSFGVGSNAAGTNTSGGGGGYYGGSGGAKGSQKTGRASGGGGSSFISGMKGCNAIDPTNYSNPRTHTGESSLVYSESAFGSSLTWKNDDRIEFSKPVMVDGKGYKWAFDGKEDDPVGIPDPTNLGGSLIMGNPGQGYARITLLDTGDVNVGGQFPIF
ncbi:MAG: fimbrillin family protein [Tannerellaceae bacterium]|nr:fimbrillin family protein [Tannerellaceae bacterium]